MSDSLKFSCACRRTLRYFGRPNSLAARNIHLSGKSRTVTQPGVPGAAPLASAEPAVIPALLIFAEYLRGVVGFRMPAGFNSGVAFSSMIVRVVGESAMSLLRVALFSLVDVTLRTTELCVLSRAARLFLHFIDYFRPV